MTELTSCNAKDQMATEIVIKARWNMLTIPRAIGTEVLPTQLKEHRPKREAKLENLTHATAGCVRSVSWMNPVRARRVAYSSGMS